MPELEHKLPAGIENNNPGNLPERIGDRGVLEVRKGIAVYRSMLDGVIALSETIHIYYVQHQLKTGRLFLQRYATMPNVNLLEWENDLAKWMRITSKEIETKDLRLDLAWNAIDCMRCIVRRENGPTPAQYAIGGEWIGPATYKAALEFVGNWGKML